MKFSVGKYYIHESGRRIAIAPQAVLTIIWGPTLYIEAYDEHGYEPSMVEIATMPELPEGEWVEISRDEYISNFIFVPCEGCGKWIEHGAKWVRTDEGTYHAKCYNPTMEGLKPDEERIIQP